MPVLCTQIPSDRPGLRVPEEEVRWLWTWMRLLFCLTWSSHCSQPQGWNSHELCVWLWLTFGKEKGRLGLGAVVFLRRTANQCC